jgi:hypothetical protein
MKIVSRQEIIKDVQINGCDSTHLYFIKWADLEALVRTNGNGIDDSIFTHWENCQEELRIMRAEAEAEFGGY